MERKPAPIVFIACKVLEDCLAPLVAEDIRETMRFLEYGLHRTPRELASRLQAEIDAIEEPCTIVLGYGLCGNGLDGLRAGRHTLVAPRADDCIALLLGSRQAYRQQFAAEPGTYYLSKGWLEAGSDPLREYERYVAAYGEEEALWLMDEQYRNYRRLALVAQRPEDLDEYRARAGEVAKFCSRWGMRYEEVLGSDAFIRRLAEFALGGRQVGDDLVVVPPGGQLRQADFR